MPLLTDDDEDVFDTRDYPYPHYEEDEDTVGAMLKLRHERVDGAGLTHLQAVEELDLSRQSLGQPPRLVLPEEVRDASTSRWSSARSSATRSGTSTWMRLARLPFTHSAKVGSMAIYWKLKQGRYPDGGYDDTFFMAFDPEVLFPRFHMVTGDETIGNVHQIPHGPERGKCSGQ